MTAAPVLSLAVAVIELPFRGFPGGVGCRDAAAGVWLAGGIDRCSSGVRDHRARR